MGLKDFFSSKSKKSVQVERAQRMRVNYLHELEFASRDPLFSTPLKIENISASGVGLIMPPDTDFTSLQVIIGDLRFADSVYALTLKVARFNGDHVGATIENPTPSFITALKKYFETEIAAIRLKATRADYLKAVPHGTPHWFQGGNNCDLSYVSNGNDVVEFAVTVFGNHIEGGNGLPLKFSEISESTHGGASGHKSSVLLEQTQRDETMLVLARRVVHAVDGLPVDHRDSILQLLA